MANATPINREQVIEWLQQNPQLLLEEPELFESLELFVQQQGSTSLLERQNQQMRQQNEEYRAQLAELLYLAEQNEFFFKTTRKLVLNSLDAEDLPALAAQLQRIIKQDFKANGYQLFIFNDHSQASGAGYRCMSKAELSQDLRMLIDRETTVCGSIRDSEAKELFPEAAQETIASAALIPLDKGQRGLLAIGSADPLHFHKDLDTIFIDYIGEVVNRRLSQLSINEHAEPMQKAAQ